MQLIFLAGMPMLALAIICMAFVVFGLIKVLAKTRYSKQQQTRIVVVTALVICAWVALIGILAANDFFAHFNSIPPRPVLVIVVPLPFILIIAFSKKFTPVLKAVPPHWLVGMQVFRIAVELLLLKTFLAGLLPKQMTFEGGNFDILSGILAIPAALILSRRYNPTLIKVYNIIGLLLLVNILVIAVLSMPTNFRAFTDGPANSIIAEFPFIYLPGVLVVLAYTLHIFSLRQVALLKQ